MGKLLRYMVYLIYKIYIVWLEIVLLFPFEAVLLFLL